MVSRGENTIAIGTEVSSSSMYSITLGKNNTQEFEPQMYTDYDNSKRLFTVGNGRSRGGESVKSDAFTILRNGQVGVGINNFEIYNSYSPDDFYVIQDMGHIDEARLQVNGLIQSRGILDMNDDQATKIVVVDEKGVLKTIDKASIGIRAKEENNPCDVNNTGAIRYVESENVGRFEGCRNNNGVYEWISLNL